MRHLIARKVQRTVAGIALLVLIHVSCFAEPATDSYAEWIIEGATVRAYTATLNVLETVNRPIHVQIEEELPEEQVMNVMPMNLGQYRWTLRQGGRGPATAFVILTTSRTDRNRDMASFTHVRYFDWQFSEEVPQALSGDQSIAAPQEVTLRYPEWDGDVVLANGQTRAESIAAIADAGAHIERWHYSDDGEPRTELRIFFPSGTQPQFVWWIRLRFAGDTDEARLSRIFADPIPTVAMDW